MSQVAEPDVLEEARGEAWEFGPTLANHLPMLLVALDRLGADAARLRGFAETYRGQNGLRSAPPEGEPIVPEDWTRSLGDRGRAGAWRAFFAREIATRGAPATERRYLPTLLPGIAASALHALMRLGYAHLERCDEEVGTALAYWATTYLALPRGEAPPDSALVDVLARLRGHRHLCHIRPETDLLWHAMRAVGADPVFAAELDRLDVGPEPLAGLSAVSLVLFAGIGDFCALHALTSMHWVRLLPAEVVCRATLLRHLWRAIAAAYPKMGMPALPTAAEVAEMRASPCPSWPDIRAAAIASEDEHDISLVFSAWQQDLHWGDRLYRVVAARRMGL